MARTARTTNEHPAGHGRRPPAIVGCGQRWWTDSRTPEQARELSLLLPRLFPQHFARTSLVVEDASGIRAFLVGLHSADAADEAYIHFVGVDPQVRGSGTGRDLYGRYESPVVRTLTWDSGRSRGCPGHDPGRSAS